MPLYEYACSKCGHQFEARQRISEDPLKKCPSCAEEALERLVSKTSFSLKGSGWYADGYGAKPAEGAKAETPKEGAKSAEPAGKEPAKAEPAKSEPPKTESKPKGESGGSSTPAKSGD